MATSRGGYPSRVTSSQRRLPVHRRTPECVELMVANGQQPTDSSSAESLTVNETGLRALQIAPPKGSRAATANRWKVNEMMTKCLPRRDSALAVSIGEGESNGGANAGHGREDALSNVGSSRGQLNGHLAADALAPTHRIEVRTFRRRQITTEAAARQGAGSAVRTESGPRISSRHVRALASRARESALFNGSTSTEGGAFRSSNLIGTGTPHASSTSPPDRCLDGDTNQIFNQCAGQVLTAFPVRT